MSVAALISPPAEILQDDVTFVVGGSGGPSSSRFADRARHGLFENNLSSTTSLAEGLVDCYLNACRHRHRAPREALAAVASVAARERTR